MSTRRWLWLEITVPVLLIAAIWIWTLTTDIYYFPPLQDVFVTFRESWLFDKVTSDLLPSLYRLGVGLLSGVAIGGIVGLLLGKIRTLGNIFSPIIEFCRAIPAPALVPPLLLVIGIGQTSQIVLIAFGTIWPVLLSTIDGVRGTDQTYLDTGRSYGVSAWRRMIFITLPAASPAIFAGIRTSLSLSIILMVISEMVASENGVGYFIIRAQRNFAMTEMWAGIILLGLLGYLLASIFEQFERRVLGWYRGSRQRAE